MVLLIVAALVLLSTRFSESDGGPLHSMQRAVASVFGPLEEGATRALKPVRDLINWFSETFQAYEGFRTHQFSTGLRLTKGD